MSDLGAAPAPAPGSGTIYDTTQLAPDLRPVTPTTDNFAAPPSWGKMFTAARPAARQSMPLYDDLKLRDGYQPIVDALGLPQSENPAAFGDLDEAGTARFGDAADAPSDLATEAGMGSVVPFTSRRMADRPLQEMLVAQRIKARRATEPGFLPGVPDDVDGLHKYFEQQQAAKRAAGAQVLARGPAFGRATASLAAGGVESAIGDPLFLPSMVIGGGTASSVVQAFGRDALINGVLSAAQLPSQAHNMAENDEHLTFGDAAAQVAEGAVVGGLFGGVVHLGAAHVPPALFKIMPEAVQQRWAARMRLGDGKGAPLLKDVLGDMDNRELAGFARSTIGTRMTPEERTSADVLERSQEIGDASPFEPGPVGDAAHNASLADTLKSIIDGVHADGAPSLANRGAGFGDAPSLANRGALLSSTSSVVRSPEPVAVPDHPQFEAQWSAIKGNEHGIGAHGEFLTSPKGAVGPAQVMPGTAPYAAKLAGLPWDEARYRGDAAYNDAIGKAYYAEQLKTFGDPEMAAAAYNAGPGSAERGTGLRGALRKAAEHGEPGNWKAYLPHETQRYVEDFGRRTGGGGGAAGVELGDGPALAELRAQADDAEAEGLALSREQAAGDALDDRAPGADVAAHADVPVLKRALFPDDESWADAQAAFHQSLNAPEEAAGRPLSAETGARPAELAGAADGAPANSGKATGHFGPEFPEAAGDWEATLAALRQAKAGVVPGALDHPEIGPIDVPYGEIGTGKSDGFGLAKLEARHPEIVAQLPEILRSMKVKSRTSNRIRLESADHEAAVSLDWLGQSRDAWLLTAYGKPKDVAKAPPLPEVRLESTPLATDDERAANGGRDGSPDRGAAKDIARAGPIDNAALKVFDDPAGAGARDQVESLEHDLLAEFRERNSAAATKLLQQLQHARRLPASPATLVQFLSRQGGIQDVGGDLASLGAAPLRGIAKSGQRKLINPRGMGIDTAFSAAIEAGYFPEYNGLIPHGRRLTYADLPDPAHFLDAIQKEMGGHPRYADVDQDAVFERARASDEDAWLASHVDDLEEIANHWGIAVDRETLEHALTDVGRGVDSAEALHNAVHAAAFRDLATAVADSGDLHYALDDGGRRWDDEANYAEQRNEAPEDRAPDDRAADEGERRPAPEAANAPAGRAIPGEHESAAGPSRLDERRYSLAEGGEPQSFREILAGLDADRDAAAALRDCAGLGGGAA